jgi:hypothetical protein
MMSSVRLTDYQDTVSAYRIEGAWKRSLPSRIRVSDNRPVRVGAQLKVSACRTKGH